MPSLSPHFSKAARSEGSNLLSSGLQRTKRRVARNISGSRLHGSKYGLSVLPRHVAGISRPRLFFAMDHLVRKVVLDHSKSYAFPYRPYGTGDDGGIDHLSLHRDDSSAHRARL